MSEHAQGIIALYRRHAYAWVAARRRQQSGPPFEAAWLDRFVDLLPSRPSVLDLGCGSGEPIGRYLADRGCDLTGVDTAPEMIDLWKNSLPEQTCCVADMRSLSLDEKFNGLLAWNSYFHLCHEDQRLMFPNFRTHAASGAILMFTSGMDHGVAMGNLEGEPLYHASLNAEEYRVLLADNGFEVLEHVVEDSSCYRHTIWLARAA